MPSQASCKCNQAVYILLFSVVINKKALIHHHYVCDCVIQWFLFIDCVAVVAIDFYLL